MEKLRQKADTPDPKIMTRDEKSEGHVLNHATTPGPSSSTAGTAKIIVASGAI